MTLNGVINAIHASTKAEDPAAKSVLETAAARIEENSRRSRALVRNHLREEGPLRI